MIRQWYLKHKNTIGWFMVIIFMVGLFTGIAGILPNAVTIPMVVIGYIYGYNQSNKKSICKVS